MATPKRIGMERVKQLDAIVKEIEKIFSSFHSLLEARKSVLLEKVKETRELYQKQQELEKAIEQLEGIKRETNEMLTENLVAANKEESVNYWDDKIRESLAKKDQLGVISNLKLFINSKEFSNSLKRIYLRETEAVEYSKRREPLVKKVKRGVGEGYINMPQGIAIDDTTGDVFVADMFQNFISVYSSEGDFIRSFGLEVLAQPYGICVSGGFVYVTNGSTCSVSKFYTNGKFVKTSSFHGETHMKFPRGLCVHKECVYVCSSFKSRIDVLNLDLEFVKRFGEGKLKDPGDIKIFNDEIFVLDMPDFTVLVFNTDHIYLRSIPLKGNIRYSAFFAMDKRGNFITSDTVDHCLYAFNPSGVFVATLGEAFLTSPCGVATDNKERFIVACQSETRCLQIY